jgi:S-formylglutathione hydrolase FrmB
MRVSSAVCLLITLAGRVVAQQDPHPVCAFGTSTYDMSSPRVRRDVVGGRNVYVLLPSDYGTNGRAYPVVYLLHGGLNSPEAYLVETDMIAFTAGLPAEQQAIVVMPDGNLADVWVDWQNGAFHDETLFIDAIVPHIESTYRAIRGGAFRVIAGFSGGAFGAMQLASRHPDQFAAVASFSGLLQADPTGPGTAPGGAGIIYAVTACYGTPPDPFAIFGDPVTQPVAIRNHNPTSLARNLGGRSVAVFVGNGIPCDSEDLLIAFHVPTSVLGYVETGAREQAGQFHTALVEAGIAHRFDAYDCGVHSYRYVQRDIHFWWPQMFAALGRAAPDTFDLRSADAEFSAWGWTFAADPRRALEFLDVADAGVRGVGLTGSGLTTVKTAGLFASGQRVDVLVDDVVKVATADGEGRITFTVDLGPAHETQQFTPVAQALEALGGYFTSRAVSFRERAASP